MALTSYSYIAGTSASAITSAVTKSGLAPIGAPVERGTVVLQFLGAGTADVGTVTNYQLVAGSTPDELVTNVAAVLSSTLQPVGAPITRGSSLFQVLGTITVESSGGSDYTLPAATVDTIGGVKELANIAALATDADAATIVTALNSLLADAKSKGLMVADS